MSITIPNGPRKNVTCEPSGSLLDSFPYFDPVTTKLGSAALEFNLIFDGISNLDGGYNTSAQETALCREHIAAGWVRANARQGSPVSYDISNYSSTIIICRPKIITGTANITVDSDGHVLKRASNKTSQDLSAVSSDLIQMANSFSISTGGFWHQDSFPSDFNNYLISKNMNSTRFLDPSLPVPDTKDVAEQFTNLYSQMFAIFMGRNLNSLLQSSKGDTITGNTIIPETKVFMSTALFILAESILGCYLTVTFILYIRRPWRILARMPTSPASVLAFFAASHAVKEFRKTSDLTGKDHASHLKKLDFRYGFGSFIGTDGVPHVGIEKHPYLAGLRKTGTGLTWRTGTMKSKEHANESGWWKLFEWKSSRIGEGGWI